MAEYNAALNEGQRERLKHRLYILSDAVAAGRHPEVTVTYVPDEPVPGRDYMSVYAPVLRVDFPCSRLLLMPTRRNTPEELRLDRIISVSAVLLDCLEESI